MTTMRCFAIWCWRLAFCNMLAISCIAGFDSSMPVEGMSVVMSIWLCLMIARISADCSGYGACVARGVVASLLLFHAAATIVGVHLNPLVRSLALSELVLLVFLVGSGGFAQARTESAVAKQPQVQAPTGMTCAICCSDFDQPDCGHVRHLQCGHYFHDACVTTWLFRQSSCPLCRTTVIDQLAAAARAARAAKAARGDVESTHAVVVGVPEDSHGDASDAATLAPEEVAVEHADASTELPL